MRKGSEAARGYPQVACDEEWLAFSELLQLRLLAYNASTGMWWAGTIRHIGDAYFCAGRLRPDNPYLLLDEGGETGLAAEADLTTEVRGLF